ncbi:patatin-like phospholipase family protein [Candidatus Pacearchaeota archaeon]|nr:patatin-like phospholipase family protein [Candidatus Pacearchaeota archaeon]
MNKIFGRKKVGLALGSGAARGVAHIGVLKVLEKYKIPVDFIAGTSIGSVIGALYCLDQDAKKIEQEALNINWKTLIDLTLPKSGLIKGDKIENFLREKLKNKKFKDLKIPFFVSAVDIENNQEIIFQKGDVAKAIRASISLPGIFVPVVNNERILVDGGLIDPLPVKILKKEGADIIIAVNVSSIKEEKPILNEESTISEKTKKMPKIPNILLKSFQILEAEGSRAILEKTNADLIITPDLKNINSIDLDKVEDLIKSGEEAAEKSLSELKKLTKPNFFQKFFKR